MSLGVIPMFWFEFLKIFGEKSQKGKNQKNWASRAPSPRHSPTSQRWLPHCDEVEGPNWPPLSYAAA